MEQKQTGGQQSLYFESGSMDRDFKPRGFPLGNYPYRERKHVNNSKNPNHLTRVSLCSGKTKNFFANLTIFCFKILLTL